jgi:hypothetical protein
MKQAKKTKCLTKTIDRMRVMRVYGDLFYALRAIINEYNPMNFGHLEVAPDEYDPEVATIISQLKQQMTKDEVHTIVFQEFKRWFAPLQLKKADYSELSNAIYSWLLEVSLSEVSLATVLKNKTTV